MPDEPEPTEEELEERLRKLLDAGQFADDEELGSIELKLREVEDKLTQTETGRKESEALFDAEFEDRMQKLHERADRAKHINTETKRERERNLAAERDSARGLGIGLTISYTIVGLPLVGAFFGWLVSRSTGATLAIGIGAILGMVLGMTMALLMLSRQNRDQ